MYKTRKKQRIISIEGRTRTSIPRDEGPACCYWMEELIS